MWRYCACYDNTTSSCLCSFCFLCVISVKIFYFLFFFSVLFFCWRRLLACCPMLLLEGFLSRSPFLRWFNFCTYELHLPGFLFRVIPLQSELHTIVCHLICQSLNSEISFFLKMIVSLSHYAWSRSVGFRIQVCNQHPPLLEKWSATSSSALSNATLPTRVFPLSLKLGMRLCHVAPE